MKKLVILTASLVVLTGLVVGCGNTEEKEQEAILELVSTDSTWFDAGTPSDQDQTPTTLLAMADSSIADSILWWRGSQTHDEASVTVEVVGDSGYVEWSRTNHGDVNIWRLNADTTWTSWGPKTLNETAKIRGIYRKTGKDSDPNRGWTLEKISCAIGSSDDVNTVKIDSIHIKNAGGEHDFTIIDPLNEFFDVDNLIAFHSAESVTITIYTNSDKTVAYLHTIVGIWPVRTPFTRMTGGMHQGTWQVQVIPYPRFAIFDVMNESTLWTQDGSYDFSGVLFPYTIQ